MMSSVRKLAARWLNRPDIHRRRLRQFQRNSAVSVPPRENPPSTLCVVVPVFNHAAYLPAALASLAAQSRFPDEVLLMVDASPDHSLTVAEETLLTWTAEQKGRTRILVNPANLGQAASINRAVASSASELIMILNDDDVLLPHAVQTTLDLFAHHPAIHLTGAHALHFQGESERLVLTTQLPPPTEGQVDLRTPDDLARYRRGNDMNLTHSASCFTRVAWQSVGGYQPDPTRRVIRFSDRDFQLRIAALFPVALLPAYPLSLWRTDSSVDAGRNS